MDIVALLAQNTTIPAEVIAAFVGVTQQASEEDENND